MSDISIAPSDTFDTTGSARRVEKPWGFEIHWTPADRPYVGKVLHIRAGKRLSLQVHDEKQESWFLMSGRAKVVWDDGTGTLVETELAPGLGYSCSIGQRHRLVGAPDWVVLGVPPPETGPPFRLGDDYARPDETDAVRHEPGRGWTA